MSCDLYAFDFPPKATTVADIPANYRAGPLGDRSDLLERIIEVVPDVHFSDPSWGVIDGADWSIELGLGDEEVCEGIACMSEGAPPL